MGAHEAAYSMKQQRCTLLGPTYVVWAPPLLTHPEGSPHSGAASPLDRNEGMMGQNFKLPATTKKKEVLRCKISRFNSTLNF